MPIYTKEAPTEAIEIASFLEVATPANIGAVIDLLSLEAKARIMLQMPWTSSPGDPDALPNLAFAGHVAQELGPDHCQALYHFAVRCTKIA